MNKISAAKIYGRKIEEQKGNIKQEYTLCLSKFQFQGSHNLLSLDSYSNKSKNRDSEPQAKGHFLRRGCRSTYQTKRREFCVLILASLPPAEQTVSWHASRRLRVSLREEGSLKKWPDKKMYRPTSRVDICDLQSLLTDLPK